MVVRHHHRPLSLALALAVALPVTAAAQQAVTTEVLQFQVPPGRKDGDLLKWTDTGPTGWLIVGVSGPAASRGSGVEDARQMALTAAPSPGTRVTGGPRALGTVRGWERWRAEAFAPPHAGVTGFVTRVVTFTGGGRTVSLWALTNDTLRWGAVATRVLDSATPIGDATAGTTRAVTTAAPGAGARAADTSANGFSVVGRWQYYRQAAPRSSWNYRTGSVDYSFTGVVNLTRTLTIGRDGRYVQQEDFDNEETGDLLRHVEQGTWHREGDRLFFTPSAFSAGMPRQGKGSTPMRPGPVRAAWSHRFHLGTLDGIIVNHGLHFFLDDQGWWNSYTPVR